MKFTPDQQSILAAKGKNLLISASAGSGKTTIMIEKIVTLLSQGADLNQFLVSTFTKAAAADMKAKLISRLRKLPQLRPQLKKAATADITNLDSFCQRLLTKYFYVAGVDPDFEVIDENRRRGMVNRLLDQIIAEENASARQDFAILYRLMLTNRRDDRLREAVIALYDFAVCQPRPQEFLHSCLLDGHEREFDCRLARFAEGERRRLKEELITLFRECEEAGFKRNLDYITQLIEFLEGEPLPPAPRSKVDAAFTELNRRCGKLKERCLDAFSPRVSYRRTEGFIAVLIRLADKLLTRFAQYKRENSYIDYADLEHYGCSILADDEVKTEIVSRYSYVFVDEYQDINPLQEKLVSLLAAGGELFMVGDVKQSIYAFRGCEPSIFLNKAALYEKGEGGSLIRLNVNYRCGKNIIDFVNEVMDRTMTPANGGVDYKREARLRCGAGFDGEPVKMYLFRKETPAPARGLYDITAPPASDPEAAAAAYRIASLIGQTVEAANGHILLRPRDIAVLSRAGGAHIERLTAELKKMNVPFMLARKLRYRSLPEIKGLLSYLDFIDNHADETALCGAMLSYIGGFTAAELLEIKRRDLTFAASVAACEGRLAAKLQTFWQRADRYTRLSAVLPAAELTNTIVAENEYFKYVLGAGGDGLVLDEFLEYIRTRPAAGLHEILALIEEEEPECELGTGGDAVKILTVHGSKGLEFPAVILYGAGRRLNRKTAPVIIDRELKAAVKFMDEEAGEEENTDLYEAVKTVNARREAEEELRLLYVGLTRAQSLLEIFGTGEKGFLAQLLPFKEKYAAVIRPEPLPAYIMPPPADVSLVDRLKQRLYYRVTALTAPQKTYVTKLAAAAEEEPARYLFESGDEGGALRGSAFHKAMELIDFCLPFQPQWLSLPAEIRALCERQQIERAVARMKELTANKTVYKEKSFILPVKAAELHFDGEEDVLVQGVVDLLIVKKDRAVIVDYKTGDPRSLRKEAYKYQLQLYIKAVKSILGLSAEAFVYSFESGEFISL